MNVEEMEAGRELDKLIIERVFGVKRVFKPCEVKTANAREWGVSDDYCYIPSGKPPRTHMIDARIVPYFSDNIAAAWQVVEHLHGQDFSVHITTLKRGARPHRFMAWIVTSPDGNHLPGVSAETAPLAICRAALMALVLQNASAPAPSAGPAQADTQPSR